MDMEIKILDSDTNTPSIRNLTAMYGTQQIPISKRRFSTIANVRKFVRNIDNQHRVEVCSNDVRFLDQRIKQHFHFKFKDTTTVHTYINKLGLVFDGGSLPLGLQFMVKNASRLGYACHDDNYFYETVFKTLCAERNDFNVYANSVEIDANELSQRIADDYLRANHRYRKVSYIRHTIVYYALRAFGWRAFSKYREQLK